MSPVAALLVGLVRAYQLLLRPLIGENCRFQPSCSAYATAVIGSHGAARGSVLAGRRLLRCNPWSAGGYDPPPSFSCDASFSCDECNPSGKGQVTR